MRVLLKSDDVLFLPVIPSCETDIKTVESMSDPMTRNVDSQMNLCPVPRQRAKSLSFRLADDLSVVQPRQPRARQMPVYQA